MKRKPATSRSRSKARNESTDHEDIFVKLVTEIAKIAAETGHELEVRHFKKIIGMSINRGINEALKRGLIEQRCVPSLRGLKLQRKYLYRLADGSAGKTKSPTRARRRKCPNPATTKRR